METDKITIIEEGAAPIVEEVMVTETPAEETPEEGDILSEVKSAVVSGAMVKDFKLSLALKAVIRDNDDVVIGRIGRTGQFHLAIISARESNSNVKTLIGGELKPMNKEDYEKYFQNGTFMGSDLILLSEGDSMILIRGSFIIMHDGSVIQF